MENKIDLILKYLITKELYEEHASDLFGIANKETMRKDDEDYQENYDINLKYYEEFLKRKALVEKEIMDAINYE